MFCSEDTFEKYSLFGPFEYQLKQHAINQTDANFDVVPFVDLCKHDTHWYNDLVNHMFERDKKLQPNINTKKPIHLDIPHYQEPPQIANHPTTSKRHEQTKPSISPAEPETKTSLPAVHYSPKSPESMESSNVLNKIASPVITNLPKTYPTVKPAAARELITHDYMETAQVPPPNANSFKKPNQQQKNFQQKSQPKSASHPWTHDTKAVNIMKNWYPLRFKLAYPRKSVLNTNEQKEFLQLHARFRNRTHVTEKEVKHYKTYSHLRTITTKERDTFLEFSKKYFETASEDYEFVNQTAGQYINEMIKFLEACPLSYDRYFTKLEEFTLKQLDSHQKANFVQREKLVVLGNIPKVIVPSISQNSQPNLTINYDQISSRAPVSVGGRSLSKIPIANDENAEKLALKYKANLVLTNSSFVNLIYFLSVENRDDLKMPISVKELKHSNGDVQKVVFIDKPFIEKALSRREKNEKFFKRSLMVSFIRKAAIQRQRTNFRAKQATDMDSMKSPMPEIDYQSNREIKKSDVDHTAVSKFESFGVIETKVVEENISSDGLKRVHDNQSADKLNQSKKLKLEIESTFELVNKITEQMQSKKETEKVKEDTKSETNLDSSDYDDYNDDLVIATDNNKEDMDDTKDELEGPSSPVQKNITTPSSPPMIQNEVKRFLDKMNNIQEPESASEPEPHIPEFQPKVIPLIRNEDETKPTANKGEDKPIEKLTLSDLLSKMEEKLTSATASVTMNNPAQHMLSTLTPTVNKKTAEVSKDFINVENKHGNVGYHLWESNSLKFILRLSVDGYINTESSSLNSVVLYPKLEYQPQFGGEKLSHRDYCKMWAKSFIRNNCDVMLCRVNVFMNKLISATTLNHADILTGYTGFNPQLTLNLMNSLLEKLTCLPQDHYLLSKDSHEDRFSIMKAGRSEGSFDLHYFYSQLEKVEKKASWLPVDPEIYFPYHHQLSRVPCLFEPDSKNKNSPSKNARKGKRARKDNKKTTPPKSNVKL